MSDLPKCRICKCNYVSRPFANDYVFACSNNGCFMSAHEFTYAEWTALMGRGEPVDINQFALSLMQKAWSIGNRHGPDSQRKAEIQIAIAEAVSNLQKPAPAVDDSDLRHAVLTAWIWGYEKGHDDTVESRYGCIEEQAKDYVEDQFGKG